MDGNSDRRCDRACGLSGSARSGLAVVRRGFFMETMFAISGARRGEGQGVVFGAAGNDQAVGVLAFAGVSLVRSKFSGGACCDDALQK